MVAIATLVVGSVAAVAAATGLVLDVRTRRPNLVASFSSGFAASERTVTLLVRFENLGHVVIPQIDVYASSPGAVLSFERSRLDRFALEPGEHHEVELPVPRPKLIEMYGRRDNVIGRRRLRRPRPGREGESSMHEQDTPGYDDLREAERLVDVAGDLMRRAEELVGRQDDYFVAFVDKHPELDELRYFDPEEVDALAEIRAQVRADSARWSYRLRRHLVSGLVGSVEDVLPKGRYRVRLVDWLDGALLPIGN